ncbi:NAD-dependent protein deacetylase sirtuin-1 isoform X1 [Copidosoma floridanum]|uniref:NAD-dependent protein deacetylase sirtuin-1 isoform X2 n=1 Tax=Copidosoma floridanum TaxID=29053 RepID=UPI0006C93C44|nr:NAD-dependent protein deacetylase sirtuin-1 isoform X2 [Copidosoma floridanum]XP_014216483.1 NAD-dependent protein deacetylase sirtuin-1 isoform X1 [Copidosoma floridanum]XP_014216484.1 NAD-dependent protein deacetylase sirtuin-1 isoform X2 [Copidosoma floridanum]XP_023247245.1 NAD-dependent protein deacetylase sirtuin-1 isoform X1 [Copidosoma floridanum]
MASELWECQRQPTQHQHPLEAERRRLEELKDSQEALSAVRPSLCSPVPPGAAGDKAGCSEPNDYVQSTLALSELTNSSITPTQTDSLSDDTGFPLDTADEKDEVSSTISNLSDISGISMLSEDGDDNVEWRNASSWVQKQIQLGTDPRDVLKLLSSDSIPIPEELDDITLWRHVIDIMSEPPKRQKLSHLNTILDVVELIKKSKNIIVLTGAGVSVSCGIPDFRSRDGIYSRLAQDFPDLPDPQAMFDINYFSQDPRPFYKFAREIYPGQFKPSPCHKFIKMLEKQNKLLRNYSQNIDTLERVAGIENLIECHGSFATASCTKCKFQVKSNDVKDEILAQKIPMCPKCQSQSAAPMDKSSIDENYRDLVAQGVLKPDIVFFGEGLPDAFHDAMANDKDVCDLLIVIGSSLKVRPVALIPSSIPHSVPQILINRESLPHLEFDVELLGDGDIVINQLCHMLDGNYKEVCWRDTILEEAPSLLPSLTDSWEQSQDTLTNQEYSQDSEANVEQDSFSHKSTSKKEIRIFSRDERDDSEVFEGRKWKKFKSDSDFKEVECESSSCSRFYSNFVDDKYEEKKNTLDQENEVKCNLSLHSGSNSNSSSNDDSNSSSPRNYNIEHSENDKFSEKEFWVKDNTDRTLNNESYDGRKNSSFHSEYVKDSRKDFTFIEQKQIIKLNFAENSIRHDGNSGSKSNHSLTRESLLFSPDESPTTSYESLRAVEEIFMSDECHVVPRIDCLRDDSTLEENPDPCKSSDKSELKPRHTSIDSVMDSALGDSCSSSDCQKGKTDGDNTDENKKSDSHSWHLVNRDSLASRLPENSFYQMKSGKYIFPGAEIYTNFPWNEGVLQIGGLRSALTASQLCEH